MSKRRKARPYYANEIKRIVSSLLTHQLFFPLGLVGHLEAADGSDSAVEARSGHLHFHQLRRLE